jgi:hypothetical protein
VSLKGTAAKGDKAILSVSGALVVSFVVSMSLCQFPDSAGSVFISSQL